MDETKSNVISLQDRKPSVFQTKLKAAREISKRARGGGRCLDAVWERSDLSTGEKAVLCQIGAFHDYKHPGFTRPVYLSVKRLAQRTSLSLYGVRKILKSLQEKRLIFKTHRQKKSGADDTTAYQLSPKLFTEYARVSLMGGGSSSKQRSNSVEAETEKPSKKRMISVAPPMGDSDQRGETELRGGSNSVEGGEQLSCDQFPSSSSSSFSKKENPSEVGGGCEERKITLAEIEGSMLSLYSRYTQPKVISALIRSMLRKRSAGDILEIIEDQRRKQDHLIDWDFRHTDIWLAKLESHPRKETFHPERN